MARPPLPAAPPPLPGAAQGASSLRPGGARGWGPSFLGRRAPRPRRRPPVGIRPRRRFSGRPLFSPKIATLQVRRCRLRQLPLPRAAPRVLPGTSGKFPRLPAKPAPWGRGPTSPGDQQFQRPRCVASLQGSPGSARRPAVDRC